MEYRYFYHLESDCLMKIRSNNSEEIDSMLNCNEEVSELTREEFLQVAERLYGKRDILK